MLFRESETGGGRNVLPQWQGIAGNGAVAEGERMENAVQGACGAGMAGRTIPQWQQNAENGAVVVCLRGYNAVQRV